MEHIIRLPVKRERERERERKVYTRRAQSNRNKGKVTKIETLFETCTKIILYSNRSIVREKSSQTQCMCVCVCVCERERERERDGEREEREGNKHYIKQRSTCGHTWSLHQSAAT